MNRLLDLSREAQAPVHYTDVAQALDVSPVTAYEMLRLLEDKGLAESKTVRPDGRRGRSIVVFSPTQPAHALLAELGDASTTDRAWEEAKTEILEALEAGRGSGYRDLLDELLLRIPKRRTPLLFAADTVTAIILVLYELRGTAAAQNIFPLLTRFGPPGWAILYSMAGLSLALSLVEKANRKATSLLLSHSQQFHKHLDNLADREKARLSVFIDQVLEAVGE